MGIALCKNGHLIHANGFYKNGTCKSCALMQLKNWQAKHPEQLKATRKAWSDKNRDKLREQDKNWKANNPDKVKEISDRYKDRFKRWDALNRDKRTAYRKKTAEELADVYVIHNLKSKLRRIDATGELIDKCVTPELVELNRQHLLLKRGLKKIKEVLNGSY